MSRDAKNTKLIGFATEYFTLWNLTEIRRFEIINNVETHVYTDWKYTYIQNLSKSETEAIIKFKEKYNFEPEIDESLRGQTTSFTKTERMMFPYTVFPFGKLQMVNILETDDVWQLNRVLTGEGAIGHPKELNTSKLLKRKVLARKRLIELGEIIKFKHSGDKWDDIRGEWILNVSLNYITKRDYEHKIKVQNSFYLHTDKERVDLELREIKRTGYDSMYGYVSIVSYNDLEDREYIYKGTSSPCLQEEEFTKVKATIKHEEYKGVKQTIIQRVKLN